MRILFIDGGDGLERNGRRPARIAQHLAHLGAEAILLTGAALPGQRRMVRNRSEGVERIELPVWFRSGDIVSRLIQPQLARQIVLGEPFDLVHVFNASEPFVWHSAKALLKRKETSSFPFVVDWDNWYGEGGLVERKALRRWIRRGTTQREESLPPLANATTVVSALLQERAERLGVSKEKLHRIGNGADLEITERLDRAECRRRLGLPEDPVMVLLPEADHRALLLALKAFLGAAGDREDVLLVTFGDTSRSGRSREASDLLNRVKSDPRIRFAGNVANGGVPPYLAAADIIALPLEDNLTDQSRFPLILGDCLAAERAVVASDVGETGRILREQGCGLVARDEEEFSRRLADLLDSRERRRHLGFLGHRTALHHLGWSSIAERMMKVYDGLLKGTESRVKSRVKKEKKS